jgi:hypothetical protein
MLTEPGRQSGGRAVFNQVDRAVDEDVEEDCPVDMSTTKGEVVHAEYLD